MRPNAAWVDRSLPLVFLCYALAAVSLLAIAMPPFGNPDELNHFLRADSVSRRQWVGQRFDAGRQSGGLASPAILSDGSAWTEPVLLPFPNTSVYPPLFYLPSAVAIWAGRAVGLTIPRTLLLARLLGGLASAVGVAGALLICRRAGASGAGLLIFALATLPMSLALQSACGQDGPMLGAAALAGSCLAWLRAGRSNAAFAPLCLCLALIAMARPPYLPLALVALAVPVRWEARLAGAAAIAAACLGWTMFAHRVAYIDTAAQHGADPAAQLRLLLDPLHFLRLIGATLARDGRAYLEQFVGRLGALDLPLPRPLILASLAVLALCSLAAVGRPRARALLIGAAVLLSAACVFVAQDLTWTAVGAPVIEGVQGRYFLPLALILAGVGTTLDARLGPVALAAALALPPVAIGLSVRAIVARYGLPAW